MVRAASKVVVFTGAGISTACGIPDFRGPSGIWTLQKSGKPLPRLKTSFEHARPSLTHQALVALVGMGKVHYVCSQNVVRMPAPPCAVGPRDRACTAGSAERGA